MTPRPNVNTSLIQELQTQVVDLAAQWSNMKNEFEDMKKKSTNSDKKIDRILQILENDDSIGQKGLVHRVNENTSFRKETLTQVKMVTVLVSVVVSLLVAWVKNIIYK